MYATLMKGMPAIAALLSLTAWNCFKGPLAPVPPKWDTDLTMQLSNRTIYLLDVVTSDTALLKTGAGNQLIYNASATASPMSLNDMIALSPSDAFSSVVIGAFGISVPPITIPVQLPGLTGGSMMPISPMTVDVLPLTASMGDGTDATLAAGRIRATLQNNLPVSITIPSHVVLTDNGVIIATFVFAGTIPAYGSAWAEDDLAGDHVGGNDRLEGLQIATTGTGGNSVSIPSVPLQVTCSLIGLVATSATVPMLPAQQLLNDETTRIPLRDSTQILNVVLRSGRLDFTFASHLPVDVRLKFRLSGFRRSGASAGFEDSLLVPSQAAAVYPLQLAGMIIQSDRPNTLLDSVILISRVSIPHDVNASVTLRAVDQIDVGMHTVEALVADTASLVLKPTWVNVNATVPLNLGKLPARFSGQLNLPAAALEWTLSSSIGFPADLHIRIIGRTPSGDSVVLPIPSGQMRILPGTSTVRFDDAQVGAFLSRLAGRFPDSLRIEGSVLVNPPDVYNPSPGGSGHIGWNSCVGGTMNLRIPMKFGLVNGTYSDTLAWGDTDGNGVVDDAYDRSRLHEVKNGTMYLEIVNTMPLEANVQVHLFDASRRLLMVLPQTGLGMEVSPAPMDALGNVTVPATSSTVIQLSGTDVQQFIPARYVAYAVVLNTNGNGDVVTFRTTDSIHIRLWTTFVYEVNP